MKGLMAAAMAVQATPGNQLMQAQLSNQNQNN